MKKAPVLNNRDFKICLKFFGPPKLSGKQPELFSWLFYVAASRLNSPRLSSCLYASLAARVKQENYRIPLCVLCVSVVNIGQ